MVQDILVAIIGLITAVYVVVKVFHFIKQSVSAKNRVVCPGCSMNCHIDKKRLLEKEQCSSYQS